MLVTESQLRKIIRKSLRDYHLVKEIFDNKEKYQEVLVFIIQTFDKEFNNEVQSTDNPIGLIIDKVDRVLNK